MQISVAHAANKINLWAVKRGSKFTVRMEYVKEGTKAWEWQLN